MIEGTTALLLFQNGRLKTCNTNARVQEEKKTVLGEMYNECGNKTYQNTCSMMMKEEFMLLEV
jgi:hypothetical protein